MAKIGIVYGAESGIVRQIIVPDRDSQLNEIMLQNGEAAISVDKLDFKNGLPDIFEAIAAVEHFRGKPSEDPRCVVVDAKGVVVDVILADPLIDINPKGVVLKDATASIGWSASNGVLISPMLEVL